MRLVFAGGFRVVFVAFRRFLQNGPSGGMGWYGIKKGIKEFKKELRAQQILWGYRVQSHLASPAQILGTAPGFGCKKTLKYPQK